MKLNFYNCQTVKLKHLLALLITIQTLVVHAQFSITICPGETALLNSTIMPPVPPQGAAGTGQSPCPPGGGAPGPGGCSDVCNWYIERTVTPGGNFFVAPLITTTYVISSRYAPGGGFPGGLPIDPRCQPGQWAPEKFIVIVEDCSNSCPVSNNLATETLDGIAEYGSESLTCFQGTITNGANIELKSGERVKLGEGFKIVQGAQLQVKIDPCN